MKTTRLDLPVMASWMESNQRRLDGSPYVSGAFEAKVILERLPEEKRQHLREVTQDGLKGIFNGPRFARSYVDDPDYGVPFLGSTDILAADLSNLAMISKKQVKAHPELLIDEDWTLITCSGTIGRMVYSRVDMKGMAGSQHFMRVIPDHTKIPPGYLYAYLSSKFGVPLVISGTYGAIIQHIEPHHIADLPVPRLGNAIELAIDNLIERASTLREESKRELSVSEELLIESLGMPPVLDPQNNIGFVARSNNLSPTNRLDAYHYSPQAQILDQWILEHKRGYRLLEDITEDVFEVPMFKHIYVDSDVGIPFFTSGNLFDLNRKPNKYLSPKMKNIKKYILQKGWVLIARHGQIGGIIGRPQYCDSMLDKATTSDLVLRVVPKADLATAGFLYTYFASQRYGYPLIVRHATGNSIPFINPNYLKRMLVPTLEFRTQLEMDKLVKSAFEKRNQASKCEDEARLLLEKEIEKYTNV